MPEKPDVSQLPSDLCTVLEAELAHIRKTDPPEPTRDRLADLRRHYATVHTKRQDRLSALCLSGGGIRSATFSLGVLQGLAAAGKLSGFDYLSTVSGGGYIGGWLSAWIHRKGCDVVAVQEALKARPDKLMAPEPYEILQLRTYSNYLSPKVGLLSADSWTLAGTVARNIYLNWMVLVPLVAALLLVPRIHFAAMQYFATHNAMNPLLFGGAMAAVLAIRYSRMALPSTKKLNGSQREFLLFCVLPLFASAYMFSSAWAGWLQLGSPIPRGAANQLGWNPTIAEWVFFLGLGVSIHMLGYFAMKTQTRLRALGDFGAVLASGALGGALFLLLNKAFLSSPFDPIAYACWSIPAILTVFMTGTGLYVALTSFISTDEDREWWARASGWLLLAATATAVFNLMIFYGLGWFLAATGAVKGFITSAGGIGGLAAILFGMSDKSPFNSKDAKATGPGGKPATNNQTSIANLVSKLAAPLLLLFLLLLIGLATNFVIDKAGISNMWYDHARLINSSSLRGLLILLAVLAAIFGLMGLWVNVNKFSLHAMYRSRLIRAYLAASRRKDERMPNRFTGFDPDDNVPMAFLKGQRPFHVVNVALNLVGGDNLAWQQRKAESFTITPLHCGSSAIGQNSLPEGYFGAYRPSDEFAIGGSLSPISLGSAVTISGAAASPNMGYNSSPLLTFLMTFFNARLGCWLGNPALGKWREPGPIYGIYFLALEALGQTTDRRNYVNLSDGGHFDNLGLYEMVLRRCGRIVVVDASCDPDYQFEDMANAIRKIRVDLGIPISIDLNPIRSREAHFTAGWIDYNAIDGKDSANRVPDGELIYIKPVLTRADLTADVSELVPADVRHYAEANPPFPHQPTSDQFFDESQFESYRRLGLHSAERFSANDQPLWNDL